MKTEKEILAWLKRHKWYESFILQALLAHTIDSPIRLERLCCYGKLTIIGAFLWMDSDEGPAFWMKVHKKFIKWFES